MPRALAIPLLATPLLLCCAGIESTDIDRVLGAAGLLGASDATVEAGLREALEVGTRNAVRLTAAEGGFLDNARIRIPLPRSLDAMAGAMRSVGLSDQVDQLEIAMNRAAERAAAEATPVFAGAIRNMTFTDARKILEGGDTAATSYFRRTSSDALHARFEPIIDEKIHEVGLARLYGEVMTRLRTLPVRFPETPPLERYVTDRALEGLFTELADQERQIREDPAARTTDLLKVVFGER